MMEIGLEDLGGIVYGVWCTESMVQYNRDDSREQRAAAARSSAQKRRRRLWVRNKAKSVSFLFVEKRNFACFWVNPKSIWPYQIQTIQYPRYPWYPILFNTIGLLRYFCKHIPWTKELFYSLLRNGEGSEILEIVSGSVFNNNSRWNCTLLRRT